MNPIEQAVTGSSRHHDQEQHMSSEPFSMAGHLRRLADIVDANPLVSRLLDAGLGTLLTDADAGHITAIVESIEQVRRQQQRAAETAAVQAQAQAYDSGQYLVPGTPATFTPREVAVAAYGTAPGAGGHDPAFVPSFTPADDTGAHHES